MKKASQSKMLMAMVALKAPPLLSPGHFTAALRERYPECPKLESLEAKDGALVLQFDDGFAAVSHMPVPIPWADLEGPCATAWWWPEATETMQTHTSHAVVVLASDAGTPLERNIRLTQIVAALVATTDSVGVYWGSGTLVHEPAEFLEQTAELSAAYPTPQLWIDMRLESGEDDKLYFFTTGMQAFDQLEVEIHGSQQDSQSILDFTYGVVSYLLARGATLDDGETVGRSAQEKIPARHRPSMWDRNRMVLALEFK